VGDLPEMAIERKYFLDISLALNRRNALWLYGFRAWQAKNENLFLGN
jgi:hypothetical protein